MYSEEVGVAVVGASLSGLMAARTLRKMGYQDFRIFDGKANIGSPLQCGEAVRAEIFDELFRAFKSDYPKFVEHETSKHVVIANHTQREFESRSLRYYELNRPQFEQWLAEPIQKQLQLGAMVREIRRETRGFCLRFSNYSIFARHLILCCGPHFKFQKALGLIKKEPSIGYAFGNICQTESSNSAFTWRVDDHGYAWSFPKAQGSVNAGVLSDDARKIKHSMREIQPLFHLDAMRNQFGGHFTQEGPIACTVADKLLVCGDAAGMVHAATGEGIPFALLSGKFAGEKMANILLSGKPATVRNLRTYESAWQRSFGKELSRSVRVRKILRWLSKNHYLEKVLATLPDETIFLSLQGKIPFSYWLKFFRARIFQRLLKSVVSPQHL